MKLKVLFTVLLLSLSSLFVHGQSYEEKYAELFKARDTVALRQHLLEWEKADPNNPELYIANYNYYVQLARQSHIVLSEEARAGQEAFGLRRLDSPDAEEKPMYMYEDVYYDADLMKKAFDWIDRGIAKNPNRLDMHFGKLYMLQETRDISSLTQTVLALLDYSKQIDNKWIWKNGEQIEDPQNFFLDVLQSYQNKILASERVDLLPYCELMSLQVIQYYPDNVEALNNLALLSWYAKEDDKMKEYLSRAEKLSPNDPIVLYNFALYHSEAGEKKEAIKYYERLLKIVSDEEELKSIREEIAALKK